jgi:putative transposase
MLLARGIVVSYETIRRLGKMHGSDYARRIRRKPPSNDATWHLDEVVVRINGHRCWLCAPHFGDGRLTSASKKAPTSSDPTSAGRVQQQCARQIPGARCGDGIASAVIGVARCA